MPRFIRLLAFVAAVLFAGASGFVAYMQTLGPRHDLGAFNRAYDWYYAVENWLVYGDRHEAQDAFAELEAEYDFAALLVAADPSRGEKQWRRCVACHALDGTQGVGPALDGVVGRDIGRAPGFAFSPALSSLDRIWTPERLDGYLSNPKAYAPGTSMAFAGIREPQDRADLIVFLMAQSAVTLDDDDAFARMEALLRSRLRQADVAFNRPQSMVYGTSHPVELVLRPTPTGDADQATPLPPAAELLSEGLAGETVEVSGVLFSTTMQATLSGVDFEITPPGPQTRTVAPSLHAAWNWTVRPESFGTDLPLTLELLALVEDETGRRSQISAKVLTERIDVDVSTWDWLVHHASDIELVHGVVVAVGGTLVAICTWLWRRRRPPSGNA